MSYILQIETATTNCSVALSKDGITIAIKEISNGYSHAENLHVFIKELLESKNLDFSDLVAIAVSKGPGSYTGLRIGVSAAKGLCFALEIPLIAIDTLEILARQVQKSEGVVIPMLDARRMEAYTTVFTTNFDSLRKIEAEVLDENSFHTYLNDGSVFFIGNAVQKLAEVVQHQNAVFLPEALPSANEMSMVAYHKYKKNDIEDVAYFEPYYLKDFIVTPSKK